MFQSSPPITFTVWAISSSFGGLDGDGFDVFFVGIEILVGESNT